MNTDEIVTCKLAVEQFGAESQIGKAIEECAELIDALCKIREERVGTIDVVTEIADVEIMCKQLEYMFGESLVEDERHRKIEGLKKQIDAHRGKQ